MNTDIECLGLYVAPKAAIYLTATLKEDVLTPVQKYPINSRNLIHWIRAGLMTPELRTVSGRELIISFEDLVSMRVIAILRSYGLSWQKIHRAEEWLRGKTGYRRPFAIERIWTETIDIFAELNRDAFIAASRHGQLVMPMLIGEYLQEVRDMTFNPHNGVKVAATWSPHTDVLLNPLIQFGEPCIKGTRMRTRIIAQMIRGGDSHSYISRAFELTENQIQHALEWDNRLRAVQAPQIPLR